MFSKIYFGNVLHRRFKPHKHEFTYKMFMLYIDLDELPFLFSRFWFWSTNRANIASFKNKNYLCDENGDIKNAVKLEVKKQFDVVPQGPIRMLTHLSYFGYCFNPVSFYYCFDEQGKTIEFVVAQINNTPWNERFCYVLDNRKSDQVEGDASNTTIESFFDKEFHVSPFFPMDMQYQWRLTQPNEKLNINMLNYKLDEKHFNVSLSLCAKPINSFNLAKALLTFPFMTLKVAFAIYWQSLRLWLKKTPFYDHPEINTKERIKE